MQVLYIEPCGSIKEPMIIDINPTLPTIERLLGGPCKMARDSFRPYALIFTTSGPRCRYWHGRWFCGKLLLIGWRNNQPVRLSPSLMRDLQEQWKDVEVQT